MSVQIVMDGSGDSRHEFDASDMTSLAAAEKRFHDLTGKGYRAVAFAQADGSGKLVKDFDPTAPKTMFIPSLHGG